MVFIAYDNGVQLVCCRQRGMAKMGRYSYGGNFHRVDIRFHETVNPEKRCLSKRIKEIENDLVETNASS